MAFDQLKAIKPLLQKIKKARSDGVISKGALKKDWYSIMLDKKLLTKLEVSKLEMFEKYRLEVVKTDEFEPGDIK